MGQNHAQSQCWFDGMEDIDFTYMGYCETVSVSIWAHDGAFPLQADAGHFSCAGDVSCAFLYLWQQYFSVLWL